MTFEEMKDKMVKARRERLRLLNEAYDIWDKTIKELLAVDRNLFYKVFLEVREEERKEEEK